MIKTPSEFIKTKSDEKAVEDGCYYDAKAGNRVCDWIEKYCKQSTGRFGGQRIKLMQYQKDFLAPLFGWKRPNGRRRFRESLLFIPKKNGKSTLTSAIALYLLCADGEQGPAVYVAAGDREQATIVFNESCNMVDQSPMLSKHLAAFPGYKEIKCSANRGIYKALSSESRTKHGLKPSTIIFDELHTQPDRELWTTLAYGVVSRDQPLTISLSTAGVDQTSLCYEKYDYAKKILDPNSGVIDTTFYPVIFEAPKDDPWDEEDTWRACNPGYGYTLNEEYFSSLVNQIKERPSELNNFKRLHLNQWTQTDEAWLDLDVWDNCEPFDESQILKQPCYAGLDLSSTTDLTSLVLCWPTKDGKFSIKPFFWIPKDNMENRQRRDSVPYTSWVNQGYVEATPGNCIDYDYVYKRVGEIKNKYRLRSIAFDRWGAEAARQMLQKYHLEVVSHGQGFGGMSSPSKDFERFLLQGNIKHDRNPCMRWNIESCTIKQDESGNIKPVKPDRNSPNRIDGVVAAVMSLTLAIANTTKIPYADRKPTLITTEGGEKNG